MENAVIEYAPIVLVVIYFILQHRLVVTPEALERARREIMQDIDDKYATRLTVDELKEQFRSLDEKLDKIYNLLLNKE